MSVDTLGHSPRRVAKAPPPPVPPKRFQVKEALQDLGVLPPSTPEDRKPSAVERLAADKGRFIKSQPIVLSKTPPMTAVPVSRKQLAPPTPSSAGQPKASPQRPVRKAAPPAAGHSGAPLLDLKHLTNLISGVGETASAPPSQTANSSSSLSSEGTGVDEPCSEPAVTLTSDPTPLTPFAPSATPAHLSPSPTSPSPSLDSPRRAGSDASGSGSQGCPAVAVRRVDVRPQMAPSRKAMRGPLQSRMPAHRQMPMAAHAKLQQQAQSQAHLMYLLKAQMASKNASVLPRNAPVMPPAKLPPQGMAGGGVGQRVLTSASQPCLPPQQSSNGSPPSKSPTAIAPDPSQPVSATQSSAATPSTTLPPTAAKPAEPPTTTAPTPTQPLSSALSAFLPGGSNSPVPAPSPSPSITRLSSTGSRKRRPSLTRSKSDVSDRFSRAGADLERFFNYCGLDPADLDDLTQPGSDIASVSVSRLRSASAPASECSQAPEHEEEEDEAAVPQVQRTPYGISVIERNARVIKWLYGLRQARDPARVANI